MPGKFRRRSLPAVGTQLIATFNKRRYTAVVVAIRESSQSVTVRVRGKDYASLSAAAMKITGHDTNGWVFWGLQKRRKPSKLEVSC